MKKKILNILFALVLVVSFSLLAATPAEAQTVTLISDNTGLMYLNGITTDGTYLYICGNDLNGVGAIARVPVTGGSGTILYRYGAGGLSIAVIGDNIFWIDPNSGPYTDTQILKALKDGSGPITAILTSSQAGSNLEDGSGLTADGVKLYGADEIQGRVYSLNPDGSGLTKLDGSRYSGWFNTEHLNTIAENGGILYVADSGRAGVIQPQIVTIPKTGASSFTPLRVGAPFVQPVGITVGAGKVFVSDPGAGNTIWVLPTTGGTPTALISGSPFVSIFGLTFFNDALYVADSGGRAIYRVATFAINTYTITATAGTGGSITPSGAVTVNNGASQAFTITPSTGYHIADVLVDGVSVGAVSSYTFSDVTAGHTIAASFAITQPTVPAVSSWGGVAMVLLIGGSMVWVIRRRQIRSETR